MPNQESFRPYVAPDTTESTSPTAALHPLLKDTSVYRSKRIVNGVTYHRLAFGTEQDDGSVSEIEFDSDQVANILSAPIADQLDSFGSDDIRQGLRAQTYPNSRIFHTIRRLSRAAGDTLHDMKQDLLGLAAVIANDDSSNVRSAAAHLYEPWQAEIAADAHIHNLNPRQLKRLCDDAGITADKQMLRRARRPHKAGGGFMWNQARLDPEALQAHVLRTRFMAKSVLDGEGMGVAWIPRHEMPAAAWVAALPYVERQRLRTDNTDEIAPYWDILLRHDRGIRLRHVATPAIEFQYVAGRERLVFHGAERRLDGARKRLIYSSPLLGAALVAQTASLDIFEPYIDQVNDRNPHVRWKQPQLHREAAAVIPPLIAIPTVAERVACTAVFASLREV